MLVKCIAVPKERTPKKVEVILSRIVPAQRNVVRINARIAEPAFVDDVMDDGVIVDVISEEDTSSEAFSDNLEGITPVIEYYSAPEPDEDEPIAEVNDEIDIEDLENDLLSLITSDLEDAENDLAEAEEAVPVNYDDEIVQRHFIRGDTGELFMSDSEDSADGHEVACYDNEGKLKRACGVIRKGQPAIQPDYVEDIYDQAVIDMFANSED